MATGWVCPRCELVMAPHVAQHRCDPPTAGVATILPQGTPGPWPAPIAATPPYVVTATFGSANSGVGVTAEACPPRLQIVGGPAA
jgi:hypothetical protein